MVSLYSGIKMMHGPINIRFVTLFQNVISFLTYILIYPQSTTTPFMSMLHLLTVNFTTLTVVENR